MVRTAPTRGAVAALTALGTLEVVAALAPGVPSAVGSVADVVVGVLPGGAVTPLLSVLRSLARPLTLIGVVVGVVAAGRAIGGLALRRSAAGTLAVAGLVGLGALAQLAGPGTDPVATLVAAAGATVVGTTLVRRPANDAPAAASPAADAAADAAATDDTVERPDRRRVLRGAVGGGALLAAGAVLGGGGRLLGRAGGGSGRGVGAGALPPVPSPLGPVTAAQDLARGALGEAGLAPVLTPLDEFFRIDTALALPRLDAATWRLRVHGRVDREVVLDLDDLVALGLEEVDATIACVSNEVGGGLVGTARWTGVPLARVLELAGPRRDAEQVVGRSADGWTAGFPLDVLADGRRALVAIGMDGVPLPDRHGFPARLVVPGLYGYVSGTKWLTELELTGWDAFDAYWVPRGWAKEAPVKTASRIDVPRRGVIVDAGPVTLAGVAWAPTRGVARVEFRVDGGAWQAAETSAPLSADAWVQWRTTVTLAAGERTVEVRAVDGTGAVQPEGPRPVIPDGAEGWHRRTMTVR